MVRVRENFLIFGSPRIEEDEIEEVAECLRSGWISTGPRVAQFEKMFAEYIGSGFAVALNSCTAGLHLALKVAGIDPGDEVITTPMTFGATANVIVNQGAIPVFVDINRKTQNIDPQKIEEKITPRTRVILPVHMAGRPCDMDEILHIAKTHNLVVIEDAAHALEARYKGRKIGAIGDVTAFSFYVTKNLTTSEGGMVTTQNEEWADRINTLRLHGLSKGAWKRYSSEKFLHYQVLEPGFKYNMMDIQAAMGLKQLEKIENYWQRRNRIWEMYDAAFQNLPVQTPAPVSDDIKHARHLYTLMLDVEKLKCSRDEFQQALYELNIGTGIHFLSLHLHPYYRERFGFRHDDFPEAEYISERTISLPLSAKLTDVDVADVIQAVVVTLKKFRKKEWFSFSLNLPKKEKIEKPESVPVQ